MGIRAKSLVVAAAALAGSALVSAPAHADYKTQTCIPYFTFALGNACFDATGDKFLLSDNRADGMRLVVRWVAVDGSGRSGECHDADGASNGVKVCDYNFREGKNNYVKFQAMTRKGANGKDQNISPALNGYITPR